MNLLISVINATVTVLILFVFLYSLLSFFLPPTHPVRQTMGLVVEPMLVAIRKAIPTTFGGLDFSVLILMILLQIIGAILVAVLRAFT